MHEMSKPVFWEYNQNIACYFFFFFFFSRRALTLSPASGNFCRLLITSANSLDPDQA